MIPDFPLFVPLPPSYDTTHSVPGVLIACLPLGLASFLLFQVLMKRPLFALLPAAIQRRCVSLSSHSVEVTPKLLGCVSLAVVVGACTHLFWDSFTHSGRWGTHLFPGLEKTALTIGGRAIPGFKLLQYGSTLFGLPGLLLLLSIWLGRRVPEPLGQTPILSGSSKGVAYLIAVATPVAATVLVWSREDVSRYDQLGRSIRLSGLALMILTLTYCLAFHAIERWSSPANRR